PGMDQPGMNGNRFHQPEPFQRDFDGDSDDDGADDFVPQQRSFPERERQPYNQNQPQPVIPQNAFPHVQPQLQPVPAPAPVNGSAPHPQEGFPGLPEAPVQRRRRRRPMSDGPAKSFNGRHPGGNGGTGGSDSAPDEAAS